MFGDEAKTDSLARRHQSLDEGIRERYDGRSGILKTPGPPMRRYRPLTIADAMILVSASAIGALILRSYLPGFLHMAGSISSIFPDRWGLWQAWYWVQGPASCVVVPWMAAMIVIRLRAPRPNRFRLACQPGFIACLAVMASLLPGMLWYASIQHRPGFQLAGGFEQAWVCITRWTNTAVIGGWLSLALSRRFRPEPSWIDRMGRVLGVYWLVSLLGYYSIEWVQRIVSLIGGGA
jgi:hypothetical protein